VVRKTQFPRLVIPLAVVLTSLFNLGLNLIVVFAFILGWGITPDLSWLLFPLVLLLLFVLTTAVSMIVSSLFPRFRDMAIIWTVAATLLFYATPVLYPLEAVPDTLRQVLLVNPLTPIFELARVSVIDSNAAGPIEVAGGWTGLVAPIALYALTCVLAVWVFNREAPRIAEEL
jgi:ABC-2 type transport system permease protein